MRKDRVYLPLPLQSGSIVQLDERGHRHLTQVLRKRAGDEVTLFNGDGHDYTARVTESSRRETCVEVLASAPAAAESPLALTLCPAIAKTDPMAYALQKAVELGVHAIQPLYTERSQPLMQGDRLRKRMQHWEGILISACEQCGRARIPELFEPLALHDWLARTDADCKPAALAPGSTTRLKELQSSPSHLLVGPEGGFSDQEIETLTRSGCQPVSLGPRILRTETAGVAALAVLQGLFGDL
ncbi:MAG: 16S rRNA (uracil(1498)-N(3))-methyltransferase [Gammaproteobacteria bacterium]|jgi:16S rRNA (uracil1498-N3)-methyltransferase